MIIQIEDLDREVGDSRNPISRGKKDSISYGVKTALPERNILTLPRVNLDLFPIDYRDFTRRQYYDFCRIPKIFITLAPTVYSSVTRSPDTRR